jgi:hypothetical protein
VPITCPARSVVGVAIFGCTYKTIGGRFMIAPTVTIGAPLRAVSTIPEPTATIAPRRSWTFVACPEETRGEATAAAAAAVARFHQIKYCRSYKQNDIDSLDYNS